MTHESQDAWTEIERLLDGVLDLEPGERSAYLTRECGGDEDLRARVEQLLRAADEAGSFLDRPAQELAAGLVKQLVEETGSPEAVLPPPVDRVGPYRLVREVGRGGMGAVYLAERDDDEFRRQVAVKLVQPAAAHDLTARFIAERQILAALDHPNIARMYDGGTTPGGVPYLVMEYIDGQRIDVYCDEKRLSVGDRLTLFDTVCDAVQFAHQKMVVHRDLKPTNVLVTRDGTVKLLDFGVAKLVDAREATDLTRTGGVPLTPAYASPEQLRGEPVTTATDVYALGVLLYELLTGHAPYDVAGRTPAEIERVVGGQAPTRPSMAVRPTTPTAPSAASARGTTPITLSRRLKGDLDNVVLTALRKEPERRYGSVHHLRDDLRRHVDGLPVSARAPTLAYRSGKFVRRHRWSLAAAAVVLLSLVGGLAGTAWQARSAAREARRATEVRDFLVALFESSDPDSTRGRTITAVELLDRGAARLDSGLAAEPALRADMLGVVGRIYRELGLFGKARPLLEQAMLIRRDLRGGSTSEDLAESAGDLAAVLLEQGEYEDAERLGREAVEIRRTRATSEPAAFAASLADLAAIVSNRGEDVAADSMYRQALEIDRRVGNDEATATHLANHGIALWRAARYEEGQHALEQALAMRRNLFGEEHTLVATSLLNLSTVVLERGDYARAEQLLNECLAIRRKLLGESHPHVAVVFNNLGSLFSRAGRLDEAEAAHRQALATYGAALGDAHPNVANSMNHIGVVLYFKGRYQEAAEIFDDVLVRWRAAYGTHHRNVFSVLNNLGAARREAGNLDGAEEVLRTTLDLRREAFGEEHPDVAQSLNNLGLLLVRRGEHTEAEQLFEQAIALWRRTVGNEHPAVADGLSELGKMLAQDSRCEEADPVLREAVDIRTAALAADAPLLASARLYYAECLIRLDRPDEADTLLAAALPVLTERWGEDHALTRRAREAVAALEETGTR